MNATIATVPSVSAAPRLLSEQLAQLRERFTDQRPSLREVIVTLDGRAYALLMILFALPFAAPVSVPGSSTPLGLAIAVIAAQLALGRLPWLPRRMLDWRLPAGFFGKLINGTRKIVRVLERVLRPRLLALTEPAWMRGAHLLVVTFAGLLLALPMPIPFTNTFPGWTILLFACGLLERDGRFILAGYAMLLATLIFFALLGSAITEALQHTWQWIIG